MKATPLVSKALGLMNWNGSDEYCSAADWHKRTGVLNEIKLGQRAAAVHKFTNIPIKTITVGDGDWPSTVTLYKEKILEAVSKYEPKEPSIWG
jgi:hypothetical protein